MMADMILMVHKSEGSFTQESMHC